MNYINTVLGTYPVSENDIRAAFPNTSFANPFTPPSEYKLVFPAPHPAYDPISEYVVQGTPVLTDKGHYEQTWTVVVLDVEVAEANQEAARTASIFNQIATLEATVTQRRLREATLGTDSGWLAGVDAQIAALRAQL